MKRGPMSAREWMDWHHTMERRVIRLACFGALVCVGLILFK